MDPNKRTFFARLGINTVKLPQTTEEIDKVRKALRRYKTGVPTTVKLSDTNMHDTVFSGTDLVNWVLNYFHFNNRADGLEFCKFLQTKKVFKGFNGSRQVFKDSSSSFYCFYDDDYDQYLRSLPPEQMDYVYGLMIGPLGIRMNHDFSRPILASQLIGWAMKRFVDIKNRSEAARFVTLLTFRGILKPHETDMYMYWLLPYTRNFPDTPMETCGICKQFTAILSFQPKIILSCGHIFHRACLSEIQRHEMGRCPHCDFEHTTITAMSELDLVLPFITKILGSGTFHFKSQIEEFVANFNGKYGLNGGNGDNIVDVSALNRDPVTTLNSALEELSIFICKLRDEIMSSLKLLKALENGSEKCLLTIKKYVIPKIYLSLFPLYYGVNRKKDKQLDAKLEVLRTVTLENLGLASKFRLGEDKRNFPAPKAPRFASQPHIKLPPQLSIQMQPSTASPQPIRKTSTLSYVSPAPPTPGMTAKTDSMDDDDRPAVLPPYYEAIQEFERLRDYTDIYDKLNCVMLTRHFVAEAVRNFWKNQQDVDKPHDLTLAADELVSIMCYIVCHSQVPHLVSEYAFIDDFMDEFVLHAEPGYCVTTMSMVISFLADVDTKTLLTTNAHVGDGHGGGEADATNTATIASETPSQSAANSEK